MVQLSYEKDAFELKPHQTKSSHEAQLKARAEEDSDRGAIALLIEKAFKLSGNKV